MRASARGAHISGAERLLNGKRLEDAIGDMIWRAIASYITPDEVCISIDTVDAGSVAFIKSLNIRTVESSSCEESLTLSRDILKTNGIAPAVINKAFDLLRSGPAPEGGNMRGAVILDAASGERIEPDRRRGIRVSRIDYTEEAKMSLEKRLRECGIYYERVIDALAIASKVTSRKETIAELCWSDNPDYTTGYVSSLQSGYVRITNMKEKGSPRGGRVFFVNTDDLKLNQYIHYLERQPVVIDMIGEIGFPYEPSRAFGSQRMIKIPSPPFYREDGEG